MPKNAIVVGAPRSGTSLTASVFARQHYYVTEDMQTGVRGGDDHNPFGYWEAEGVIEHNVDVLHRAGYEHHNTWVFDEITPEQARAIDRVPATDAHRSFVEEYNNHSPWMWKDPRLCYTLGYWWKLLDPETTGVLLMTRAPEAVYRSFRRLGWCEPGPAAMEHALRRINDHFANARHIVDSVGLPYVAVDYDEYLTHPDEVAARIGAHFDLAITGADLNVRTDLNHSAGRGRVGSLVRQLMALLPRGLIRFVKRILPNRLILALFPERRYVPDQSKDEPH